MAQTEGFFSPEGPFSLTALAQLAEARLTPAKAGVKKITRPAPLAGAGADEVSFLASPRHLAAFKQSGAGACLVRTGHEDDAPESMALLVVEDPAAAWLKVLTRFYPPDRCTAFVWPAAKAGLAHIHPEARLEEGVAVEPGAIIGAKACIGGGSHIGAGAVIGANVHIGRKCYIGSQSTVLCALLGDGVTLHPGVRIGQDGFGYRAAAGGIAKIPQVGRVVIQDNVEIGANSAIDRGALGDTLIGEGTKIDNLVHIAHNCHIGRFCFILGCVGFAGSVTVGDGTMIGGQAGVAGHLTIGAGAQIASRGGVTRNVPPGAVVSGFPARPVREWRVQEVVLRNLARRGRQSPDVKRGSG